MPGTFRRCKPLAAQDLWKRLSKRAAKRGTPWAHEQTVYDELNRIKVPGTFRRCGIPPRCVGPLSAAAGGFPVPQGGVLHCLCRGH